MNRVCLVGRLQLFGYELMVAYGSLLGLIREGDSIGHDDDFDLMYISKYNSMEEVAQETKQIVDQLNAAGLNTRLINNGQMHINYSGGIHLDVFVGWFDENAFNLYVSVRNSKISRDTLFPTNEVEYKGYQVTLPKNPEKLLSSIYGAGWKIPDPYFQWHIDSSVKGFYKTFESL